MNCPQPDPITGKNVYGCNREENRWWYMATGCDSTVSTVGNRLRPTVATVCNTVLILSTGWDYTVVFNGCNRRLCLRLPTVKTHPVGTVQA